jgi:lipoprotein-anchoring transpeptidase ErfK/SrfK
MAHVPVARRRVKHLFLATSIILLASLLLSACGGDAHTQQQAHASKADLDQRIAYARSIGVPVTMLNAITLHETQLSRTSAPLTIFNGQPATDYYTNMSQQYSTLDLQVQGLVVQSTQQFDYQASQDIQSLADALSQRLAQNFGEAKNFTAQLTQDQSALAKAQFPRDYTRISNSARSSLLALQLMGPTYDSLNALKQDIQQLQKSHIDTTALNMQYQQGMQQFRKATTPHDFTQLIQTLNVELQATSDFSTQAIPYVGAAKLQQFSADIVQLKHYGGSTTSFQKLLHNDQQALGQAKTISDYIRVSTKIDRDIASMQVALTAGFASDLLNQYNQEVASWGSSHQYHDPFGGGVYNLDYEYGVNGTGLDGNAALQYAESTQSPADYQTAISTIQNNLLDLRAMEADYADTTSANQPHASDITLMKHYNVYGPNSGQVLVVSLVEQELRYYDRGKLIRAFPIVSGQYLKPSPPGFWSIFLQQHPTKFKSSEAPGSAFWYPPTPIQYAMEYHSGGYFFHDAWWRADFGKNNEFPHADSSGTTSFNDNGSHGCINMNPSEIAWLYPQIAWGAAVIVY